MSNKRYPEEFRVEAVKQLTVASHSKSAFGNMARLCWLDYASLKKGCFRLPQIEQPRSPGAPPKSPTPLELAIYEYEQKAAAAHKAQLRAKANKPCPETDRLLKKAECDIAALQVERNRLLCLAQIQAGLELYRSDNKTKSATDMLAEVYHPTGDLADNLFAVGEARPGGFFDAHHIIPGKGRWQQNEMLAARLNLHLHGIGINDPFNGVFLPRNKEDKGHWGSPMSPSHKDIHRFNYETWIASNFARGNKPKVAFLASLRDVKTKLRFGGYPPEIVAPKDDCWGGC